MFVWKGYWTRVQLPPSPPTLMNDEIIFLHMPKYIENKDFILSEKEYKELDNLAELLLNPDDNFDKLLEIWNTNTKFRIMYGALNTAKV